MRYFVAQGTAGQQLIFWRVKLMFPIQIFKKICDNSLSRSEICVARSLFEVLCVREGELYPPIAFFSYLR